MKVQDDHNLEEFLKLDAYQAFVLSYIYNDIGIVIWTQLFLIKFLKKQSRWEKY